MNGADRVKQTLRVREKVECMKHIACSGIGLVLLLGVAVLPASAQGQASSTSQSASTGQSLGDYARQVRKDPGATAKPKVFDNDNLPTEDKLSVVGSARASNDSSAQADNTTAAASEAKSGDAKSGTEGKAGSEDKVAPSATAKTPDEEAVKQAAVKQWGDKLAAQKDQIDLAGRELDVLQREYQIRAAAMYADAGNRMRNSGDWDKQDAQYKQQIADKQKALEDAKQKLEDMQEDARKAGVPSFGARAVGNHNNSSKSSAGAISGACFIAGSIYSGSAGETPRDSRRDPSARLRAGCRRYSSWLALNWRICFTWCRPWSR